MSKPLYEILEHTADVGLKVYGRTLAELFENAASGMVELASRIHECGQEPAGERLALSVRGADLEELLVNWLSEVLYFIDAEGWEFSEFHVKQIGTNALEAEALGSRRDVASATRVNPVKAVTYHQLSVRETGDAWEAVVYFDI